MSAGAFVGNALKALVSPFGIFSWVLLLLALLLWFAGPLLGSDGSAPLAAASVRLAIILVLALAWGIVGVALRVRRQAEDKQLLDTARQQQDEHETATRQAKDTAAAQFAAFVAAAHVALRLLGGRRRLRLLASGAHAPCYLVLGAERSGKTAVLHNASLAIHPDSPAPTADDPAQFVVAEQGLFVEIAPACLRQDTAHERSLWQRMLGLLRRQRPVTGIVVAISSGQLDAASDEEIEAQGKLLRRRLDDIDRCFRSRPPVYIILTQLDLLTGFEEYFAALDTEERTAAFGLPLDAADAPAALAAGFADLVDRLKERKLRYLQAEADASLRLHVTAFPSRFALLQSRLDRLVAVLAARSRFAATPNLRGLFFTSAQQTEATDDRLLAALARRFALPAESSATRGSARPRRSRAFFLRGLMHDTILAEASTTGAAAALRRPRLGSPVLLTALAIAALLFVGLWWRGYGSGTDYASRLADATQTAATRLHAVADQSPTSRATLIAVIQALDGLANLTQQDPKHWSFGLFSSTAPQQASHAAYARGLENLLLPRVTHHVEKRLAAPALDAATRFNLLGYYVALGGTHPATATPATPATPASNIAPQLAAGMLSAATAAAVPPLAAHVAALVTADVSAPAIDSSVVDHARGRLTRTGLAQIAYDRLTTAAASRALPPWRPIEHVGAAGSRVFTRVSDAGLGDGIAGVYTRSGYRSFVVPASRRIARQVAAQAWVMGENPTPTTTAQRSTHIRDGLLALYAVDTMRQWDKLLADLTFVPTANAEAAARLVALIQNPPSPVTDLLQAIAKATRFAANDESLPTTTAASSAVARTARNITKHYAGLATAVGSHQKADDKAAQKSQLDALLTGLQPVYEQLNRLAAGADPLAVNGKLQGALEGFDQAVDNLPNLLQPLFDRLTLRLATATGAGIHSRLARIWNTSVLPQCRALVSGHYPFDPNSPVDAPLIDLTTVFGPEGLIASFRQNALKPYIDTTVKPWRWRAASTAAPDFESAFLAALQRANAISKTYFDAAGALGLQLRLKPLALNGAASAFQLDIGGSVYSYAYGPASAMAVHWPAPPDAAKASLSVTPTLANQRNAIVYTGPWALFRLLDAATTVAADSPHGGALPLRWALGKRSVHLEVSAATGRDIVGNPLLTGYTCPQLGL